MLSYLWPAYNAWLPVRPSKHGRSKVGCILPNTWARTWRRQTCAPFLLGPNMTSLSASCSGPTKKGHSPVSPTKNGPHIKPRPFPGFGPNWSAYEAMETRITPSLMCRRSMHVNDRSGRRRSADMGRMRHRKMDRSTYCTLHATAWDRSGNRLNMHASTCTMNKHN